MRSWPRQPTYSEHMPNPKAPTRHVTPSAPRAPDHPPTGRLRRIGVTQEEVAEAERRWADMSDDERWEAQEALNALTDEELRGQLAEGRAERDEAPAPEAVYAPDAEASAVNPEDVPEGTVDAVLDWVGDDRARAAAALLAEQRREGDPRKTLVEPLQQLLDD